MARPKPYQIETGTQSGGSARLPNLGLITLREGRFAGLQIPIDSARHRCDHL